MVNAFLGDLHCGSLWGLNPPDSEFPQNPLQEYLWKCYSHLIESWPAIDTLFLMGDLIDGGQPKAKGTQIHTTRLGTQTRMAIQALECVAKKVKRIVRVDGTAYHEDYMGALGELDEHFKTQLTGQVLDINLGNGILNIAHHPSGGSALYAGTKVDKENLWSKIAAFERHVPNARWIVRAHLHNYIRQDTRGRTVIQMPCWQLPTPHAKKNNYYRWQPDLGGVLMYADEQADGGFSFRSTLYDNPMPEVHTL